jgi:hypothetical protein
MNLEQLNAARLQQLQQGLSRLQQATCVAIDWVNGVATVNVPGSIMSLPMVGQPPIIGGLCWVGFLGLQPIVLGPVARPAFGTATDVPSAGLVPVTGDDGVAYVVTYSSDQSITAGTRVQIDWSSGGTVVALPEADPNTGTSFVATPNPVAAPTSKTWTFYPTDSGTQNGSGSSGSGSWGTNQVYCGDTTLGAYFYGTVVAGSIPDTATITSVKVYVNALQTSGSDPSIGLHPLVSKSGNVSVSSAVSVAGGSGWKTLPNSFGDYLKTGSQRGLCTEHGGYHIWAPAGTGNSGALVITAKL